MLTILIKRSFIIVFLLFVTTNGSSFEVILRGSSATHSSCVDDSSFVNLFTNRKGKSKRKKDGCGFVAKRKKKRCRKKINGIKIKDRCPRTCGACSKTSDNHDGDDDGSSLPTVESCNFPTGAFFYHACDGNVFAVIIACSMDHCTYLERMMVLSESEDYDDDGTTDSDSLSLDFDDYDSCISSGTFSFSEFVDRKEQDGSCRLGYKKHPIALQEGTCDGTIYHVKIDDVSTGGSGSSSNDDDEEQHELLIRFSIDGGKTYYNDDKPRKAMRLMMIDELSLPVASTDDGRRLDSSLQKFNNDAVWNDVKDVVNRVVKPSGEDFGNRRLEPWC